LAPEPLAPLNYFNYFTEIEEHFQRARGTGLFLLSPLDWALIETWKDAGVPLEAVLRGITAAFEKWHAKKKRTRTVNGLAWCSQAVIEEAGRMKDGLTGAPTAAPAEAPFRIEELKRHLAEAAARITMPELSSTRQAVEEILAQAESHYTQLEPLEQRLAALEDKMIATARAHQTDEDLILARQELDAQLRPYRGRMTAPQLAMLEKQYLDRWLLEQCQLPRLSLFYVR
jgi:hypothetical protein